MEKKSSLFLGFKFQQFNQLLSFSFALFFSLFFILPSTCLAQEMLVNGSFESPVVTVNGNNLGVIVPNWSYTYQSNIVKPFNGYMPSGPNAPPAGGGNQYYDSNSNGAVESVRQTFTLTQNGMVDFSAWFSVRDMVQAITGTISILNSSGTTVGTASISFAASEALGSWKQASSSKLPLSAGTYTFVITLPDYLNTDLASVYFYPAISITKSVAIVSDSVTGTTNPHAIPNAFVDYTITVKNNATFTTTNNTVVVSDATPANLAMFVGNLNGSSGGPIIFTNGSPTSGLTYSYTSLASLTDTLDFSNNNGSTWTYVPTANASGVDTNVTNFRIKPTGVMAANGTFSFRVRYQIK